MIDPLFSIILPVHNGGSYLKSCVNSILRQSFPYFQLSVLENYSTDGSLEWLEEIDDARVSIYQSSRLLNIEENWQRILEIPKREFMTIIGHDDFLDDNYLHTMHELIVSEPNASLYQTHFRLIDADGTSIRSCYPMSNRESASEFLAARMQGKRDSFGTGYMFRTADYDAIGGIPLFPKLIFSDDALWLILMNLGDKVTSEAECFSYRLHSGSTSGGVSPNTLYEATLEYTNFLTNLSRNQSEIRCTLEKYAVNHFLHLSNYYVSILTKQLDETDQRKAHETAVQFINMIENFFEGANFSLNPKQRVVNKLLKGVYMSYVFAPKIARNIIDGIYRYFKNLR